MRIAIGSDHAGFFLKKIIFDVLKEKEIEVIDFGTQSTQSADYPDFAHPVAKAINDKVFDFGILICGSGNGVTITANKYLFVRCALCWNPEIARLARLHNDANILALPGRFIDIDLALEIVKTFLNTAFEGGRHTARVAKICKMIV